MWSLDFIGANGFYTEKKENKKTETVPSVMIMRRDLSKQKINDHLINKWRLQGTLNAKDLSLLSAIKTNLHVIKKSFEAV